MRGSDGSNLGSRSERPGGRYGRYDPPAAGLGQRMATASSTRPSASRRATEPCSESCLRPIPGWVTDTYMKFITYGLKGKP